jgi:hypothetical protein
MYLVGWNTGCRGENKGSWMITKVGRESSISRGFQMHLRLETFEHGSGGICIGNSRLLIDKSRYSDLATT